MKPVQAIVMTAIVAISLGGAMLSSAAEDSYDSTSVFGGKLPPGYRDWKLISVAHEEGNINDIRAILGNDMAVKAYREGTRPFPDGAIIARVAWSYVPSEENNRVFGRTQSFIAGTPTNVQFMVKNSREYASTGGWGFAQFSGGKSTHVDVEACYTCHVPVKDRDFLFTRYSP